VQAGRQEKSRHLRQAGGGRTAPPDPHSHGRQHRAQNGGSERVQVQCTPVCRQKERAAVCRQAGEAGRESAEQSGRWRPTLPVDLDPGSEAVYA